MLKINKLKLIPMLLVQFYLTVTVLLFLFGPWDFKIQNTQTLIGLICIYQLSMVFGYFIGINFIKLNKNKSFCDDNCNIKIVKYVMIFYVFVMVIDVTRSLGLDSINLIDIIEKFIIGLKNPAEGYYSKFLINEDNIFLGKLGTIIIFLSSPFAYAIIPLIIINFKKFDNNYKIIAILIIALQIIKYIATGTNKGIFDIVIFYMCYIYLKFVSNRKENAISRALKIKVYILMIALIFLLIFVFNFMIGSRSFGKNLSEETSISGIHLKQEINVIDYIPECLKKPTILLTSYICQGYHGLDLSLNFSSEYMLGIGGSMFLVDQLDANKYTLQKKVEDQFGWHSRVQWFTIYSWIANDVGFIGVSLFMFLLGVIFAMSYKDGIVNDNLIAKVVFMLISIEIVFIPANNQLFNNMLSFFTTIFFFFLWFISKNVSFNNKNKKLNR